MIRSLTLIILCFLSLFPGNVLKAQKQLANFGKQPGPVYAQRAVGGSIVLFAGKTDYLSNLLLLDTMTGQYKIVDEKIYYCQGIQFTDNGVFYISFKYDVNGNDGKHYLNYFDYSGTPVNLGIINDYDNAGNRAQPAYACMLNGKYYSYAYIAGRHCIWESDGTVPGTKILYTSSDKIKNLFVFNQELLFVEQQDTKQVFMRYAAAAAVPLYSMDNAYRSAFNKLAEDDSCFYLYAVNGKTMRFFSSNGEVLDSLGAVPYTGSIWTPEESRIECTLEDNLVKLNIVFSNEGTVRSYVIPVEGPDTVYTVPFSGIYKVNTYRNYYAKGKYLFTRSFDYGQEVTVINKDSVKLITDVWKGRVNGVNEQNMNKAVLRDSLLYYLATNGNDDQTYLYQTNGTNTRSLFNMNLPAGTLDYINFYIDHLLIDNNCAYWSYTEKDSVKLFSRSLNNQKPQPAKKAGKATDEWHRQMAALSTFGLYSSMSFVYNQDVLFDPQGNIIVTGFYNGYANPSVQWCSPDTAVAQQASGANLIVKYDSAGTLLWVKSFGSYDGQLSWKTAMATDSKGDIYLSGKMFEYAVYGNDTLKTERAAIYLFKVEGATGKLLWKKLMNPAYWANYNSVDGIVCDKQDNIFIAVMFTNFDADYDGVSLHSDISPCNALLKLNPDGDVLWAKTMAPTWLSNHYGATTALCYNAHTNMIYAIQSQGYYNVWSSCKYQDWYSCTQKFNTDGTSEGESFLKSDDLHSITAAVVTGNNRLLLSGFYRGDFEAGRYKVSSRMAQDCNQFETINLISGEDNLKVYSAQSSRDNVFYPFDMAADDEYVYVLGSELNARKSSRMSIRKYDFNGRLLARRFLEYGVYDVFSFEIFYSIDVHGDYLAVSMNSKSGIPPYTNFFGVDGISVIRLNKHNAWETINDYTPSQKEAGVVIAPNPFSDILSFTFPGEHLYQRVSLTDMSGKTIMTAEIPDGRYYEINTGGLAPGVYIARLEGAQTHTAKVVKL